jgi:hypothetical protein
MLVTFYNMIGKEEIKVPEYIKECSSSFWLEVDNIKYFLSKTTIVKGKEGYRPKYITASWLHGYYLRWMTINCPDNKRLALKPFIAKMSEIFTPTIGKPNEVWRDMFYMPVSHVNNNDYFLDIYQDAPSLESIDKPITPGSISSQKRSRYGGSF